MTKRFDQKLAIFGTQFRINYGRYRNMQSNIPWYTPPQESYVFFPEEFINKDFAIAMTRNEV